MRKAITSVLLILLGLLAALLVLEVGLRVWFTVRGSETDRIRYLDDRAAIAARQAQLIGMPYLNYGLNPALDDVNRLGLRGPDVSIARPTGTTRILALGGSTTYGHALNADEAWPAQLQRLLREQYGRADVEVINLGVPGYFSLDSLVSLATRGLALDPDMVVVYDGVNDAALRIFQDPACAAGETPLLGMGLDRGVWQYNAEPLPPSALYRFVALQMGWMRDPATFDARLEPTGLCPPEPQGANPLTTLASNPPTLFERNLRGIVALARASDVEVVLSTFAWDRAAAEAQLAGNAELFQAQALVDAIDEQNTLVRTLGDGLDVPVIDLAAEMGDGAYYQGDQIHMNAQGTRRQAEVYAAALIELLP